MITVRGCLKLRALSFLLGCIECRRLVPPILSEVIAVVSERNPSANWREREKRRTEPDRSRWTGKRLYGRR
ncbi:hypothetical protein OG21DRAFT_1518579 [Imleria badia]|nr:hypothetical protein OG21DRAFT_1518579 [Imleria badia]